MPKPSDIILAKIQRMGGSKDDAITAIIQYLDEEWEKNKPCEHEWIDCIHGDRICKKCEIIR